MRYFTSMDLLVPSLAALIASSAAPAAGAERVRDAGGPTLRYDRGSSAQVTVSARIVRASARVGAGHAPPGPGMVPRRTTVSAADGRLVAALVYDFE